MKHTILLIDDDALILSTLKNKFGGFGMEVYAAPDPDAAREILSKITPDVVLLDLLLTKADGAQGVLDFIKSQPRLEHIPVLALTNLDKPELKKMLLAGSVKEYLVKGSISLDEIYAKVKSYLEPAES